MSRLSNILIAAVFLLWILPLGVFIKPVDEKKVCGGQRAICLCSYVTKADKATNKITFSHPPVHEKEASSGGSAHYFLTADFKDIQLFKSLKLQNHSSSLYSLIVCKPVEHVPKV